MVLSVAAYQLEKRLKPFLMTFRVLQLIDKSSYPTYTPEPCAALPDCHDEALDEGTGGFLSDNQLHTTNSDFTREVHYYQDDDNTSTSPQPETGPIPEKKNNLVVRCNCSLIDVPIRYVPNH
jgi:hypothetical protein